MRERDSGLIVIFQSDNQSTKLAVYWHIALVVEMLLPRRFTLCCLTGYLNASMSGWCLQRWTALLELWTYMALRYFLPHFELKVLQCVAEPVTLNSCLCMKSVRTVCLYVTGSECEQFWAAVYKLCQRAAATVCEQSPGGTRAGQRVYSEQSWSLIIKKNMGKYWKILCNMLNNKFPCIGTKCLFLMKL